MMLRRNPTRIELKLIDIEKEYEVMKKEKESEKQKVMSEFQSTSDTPVTLKTKTDLVHERIGYDPKPKLQPTRLPLVK